MDRLKRIMMMLAVVAMAAMCSCTKDDPNNGGGSNGGGNGSGNNGGGGNGGGSYYEEHDYVDLGLPSGNLWATCNVGASNTTNGLGYEFRWGEAKSMGGDYKYCVDGDLHQLTKYCQMPDFGSNGYIDKFMTLRPEDDAATVNWGEDWHTPSIEDWDELILNAESIEFVEGGWSAEEHEYTLSHYIITGPNGNTLYLPETPALPGTAGHDFDHYCYMTNFLNPVYPAQAEGFYFNYCLDGVFCEKRERTEGMYVRPVKSVGGGNNGNDIGEGSVGSINNHEYVDLGLPSGKLWATCNIGSSSPEVNGSYFAWAETEPKASYDWTNYKYSRNAGADGWPPNLIKYCYESYCGYNGFTDNRVELEPTDDAAVVNWGGGWHVPSSDDWEELMMNCYHGMSIYHGIEGYMFVSRNCHFLFLPLAGLYEGSGVYYNNAFYWCNTIAGEDDDCDYPYVARYFHDISDEDWEDMVFNNEYRIYDYHPRCEGMSIRPIYTP